MGYIKERDLSDGSKRFYAEVQLKDGGPIQLFPTIYQPDCDLQPFQEVQERWGRAKDQYLQKTD